MVASPVIDESDKNVGGFVVCTLIWNAHAGRVSGIRQLTLDWNPHASRKPVIMPEVMRIWSSARFCIAGCTRESGKLVKGVLRGDNSPVLEEINAG